jgi:hypothetical protein
MIFRRRSPEQRIERALMKILERDAKSKVPKLFVRSYTVEADVETGLMVHFDCILAPVPQETDRAFSHDDA